MAQSCVSLVVHVVFSTKDRMPFISADHRERLYDYMGGIDLYLQAGRARYKIRDAARLIRGVRRTPVVDGGGIKNSWEKYVILEYLPMAGVRAWEGASCNAPRTALFYRARVESPTGEVGVVHPIRGEIPTRLSGLSAAPRGRGHPVQGFNFRLQATQGFNPG